MAYSKGKLKRIGDKASVCFRLFWIGNASDYLSMWTLLQVSFKHILITLANFTHIWYSVRILYNTSLPTNHHPIIQRWKPILKFNLTLSLTSTSFRITNNTSEKYTYFKLEYTFPLLLIYRLLFGNFNLLPAEYPLPLKYKLLKAYTR